MKSTFFIILACALSKQVLAQDLGTWRDDEVKHCDISLLREGKVMYEVTKNCKDAWAVGRSQMKVRAKNEFAPYPLDLGNGRKMSFSWYYRIALSGDLEVRDGQGVIRVIESTAPKTEKQRVLAKKSKGVVIGMRADQIMESSWGRPIKVNLTVTKGARTEQWVYPGGYLYLKDGVLTGIQN